MRYALVFVLAIALGGSALALTARAGRRDELSKMEIRVVVTPRGSRYLIDRAPKDYPNKGDVIRERSTLRNAVAQFGRPKGVIVGSDTWITTIVIPPFGRVEVKATTTVPGGTIRARGAITVLQTSTVFRVVGGTGAYRNARGTVDMRNLNASGTRGASTYRLRIP